MQAQHEPVKLRGALLWWALGLWLVILVLQFGFMSRHSLWNNEFITLRSIQLDYPAMIQERLNNNHSPGYFIMLKAWTSLAGQSEAALRFPSAVLALLAIAVIWRMGAWLFGERLGLFVLAFAGLNQIHVMMGNDARMYSGLMLATAMALRGTLVYLDGERRRTLFWLVAAGLLGLFFHLLYLIVPAVLTVWLTARRRDWPGRWWRLTLAAWAPIVVLLPLVLAWAQAQRKVGHAEELLPFKLMAALRQMVIIFTGDYHGLDFEPLQYTGIVLVIVCIWLTLGGAWRARGRDWMDPAAGSVQRFDGLLWTWCLLPTVGIAVAGLKSHHQLVGDWRYYIMIGAAAPLLLASTMIWLTQRRGPRTGLVYGGGFALMLLANSIGYLATPGIGLRQALEHMRKEYQPGDMVVVSDKETRSYAFIHYGLLDAVPPFRPREVDSTEGVVEWLRTVSSDAPRLWAVIYNNRPREERLWRSIDGRPEIFEPVGDLFQHGATAVGLYRLHWDAQPEREHD